MSNPNNASGNANAGFPFFQQVRGIEGIVNGGNPRSRRDGPGSGALLPSQDARAVQLAQQALALATGINNLFTKVVVVNSVEEAYQAFLNGAIVVAISYDKLGDKALVIPGDAGQQEKTLIVLGGSGVVTSTRIVNNAIKAFARIVNIYFTGLSVFDYVRDGRFTFIQRGPDLEQLNIIGATPDATVEITANSAPWVSFLTKDVDQSANVGNLIVRAIATSETVFAADDNTRATPRVVQRIADATLEGWRSGQVEVANVSLKLTNPTQPPNWGFLRRSYVKAEVTGFLPGAGYAGGNTHFEFQTDEDVDGTGRSHFIEYSLRLDPLGASPATPDVLVNMDPQGNPAEANVTVDIEVTASGPLTGGYSHTGITGTAGELISKYVADANAKAGTTNITLTPVTTNITKMYVEGPNDVIINGGEYAEVQGIFDQGTVPQEIIAGQVVAVIKYTGAGASALSLTASERLERAEVDAAGAGAYTVLVDTINAGRIIVADLDALTFLTQAATIEEFRAKNIATAIDLGGFPHQILNVVQNTVAGVLNNAAALVAFQTKAAADPTLATAPNTGTTQDFTVDIGVTPPSPASVDACGGCGGIDNDFGT